MQGRGFMFLSTRTSVVQYPVRGAARCSGAPRIATISFQVAIFGVSRVLPTYDFPEVGRRRRLTLVLFATVCSS